MGHKEPNTGKDFVQQIFKAAGVIALLFLLAMALYVTVV
jgi:hypothetical protein